MSVWARSYDGNLSAKQIFRFQDIKWILDHYIIQFQTVGFY